MDFFKSVFTDSNPSSQPTSPNSEIVPTPASSWAFGSTFFTTVASKSDSLLDNYCKDLQEFSSGFQKETSALRQAASRAFSELPSRFESGAAFAQESLEAVGLVIENVGSAVSEIIGKDLFSSNLDENDESIAKDLSFSEISKPYSRLHAIIRGLQCNVRTYCDEVEESEYDEWKLGFDIEEKSEDIENLIEENGVIKEILDELVPKTVDMETFWCRYFYKVYKVIKQEEVRLMIVKRMVEGEDELSWDVDDEGDCEASGSGTKGDTPLHEDEGSRSLGSEGRVGSDFSFVSSQRSSHFEDDFVWYGSPSPSVKTDDSKRNSFEEVVNWDIEDDVQLSNS